MSTNDDESICYCGDNIKNKYSECELCHYCVHGHVTDDASCIQALLNHEFSKCPVCKKFDIKDFIKKDRQIKEEDIDSEEEVAPVVIINEKECSLCKREFKSKRGVQMHLSRNPKCKLLNLEEIDRQRPHCQFCDEILLSYNHYKDCAKLDENMKDFVTNFRPIITKQIFKRGQVLDALSSFKSYSNLAKRQLKKIDNSDKTDFVYVIEDKVKEVNENSIIVTDLWRDNVFNLPFEDAYVFLSPRFTYTNWRSELNCAFKRDLRIANNSFLEGFKRMKHMFVEFREEIQTRGIYDIVEIEGEEVEILIEEGRKKIIWKLMKIIDIDKDNVDILVINSIEDENYTEQISVHRNDTRIRPAGLDPRHNQLLEINYRVMLVH